MNLILVFGVSLAAFLGVIVLMAVGVMLGRREISGSCGGLGQGADGDQAESSCSLCSNPDAACRELNKRRQLGATANSANDTADQDEACVSSAVGDSRHNEGYRAEEGF
jgi:hypothetical protein